MAAPLVVPDASVLLNWVLPSDDEPDVDKALLLRTAILNDDVRAIVPALWLYEVGNTVARRFPAHASAWLTSLMKFGLTEAVPSDAWLSAALEFDTCLRGVFLRCGLPCTRDYSEGYSSRPTFGM